MRSPASFRPACAARLRRRAPGRSSPGHSALALLLLTAAVSACNLSRNVWQAGIPGVRTSFTVSKVVERGGYLDVTVTGEAARLRSFVPADAECAAVLVPEAAVDYLAIGPYGGFEREGQRCQAIGIGTLHEWRDRRPETPGSLIPRAQARYRVVYEDAELVFLRGRFPVTGRLGWVEGADTIAVVPRTPLCERPIRSGVASVEYYPRGKDVLALLSDAGRCPIEGLLQPQP